MFARDALKGLCIGLICVRHVLGASRCICQSGRVVLPSGYYAVFIGDCAEGHVPRANMFWDMSLQCRSACFSPRSCGMAFLLL